jgi:hypothetical protein
MEKREKKKREGTNDQIHRCSAGLRSEVGSKED